MPRLLPPDGKLPLPTWLSESYWLPGQVFSQVLYAFHYKGKTIESVSLWVTEQEVAVKKTQEVDMGSGGKEYDPP